MALQNRVDPFGSLQSTKARGSLLGNRGQLHDAGKNIIRSWKSRAWVTCSLEYGDIRRTIFSPTSYSELFFLDEATAFAAGHRPCGSCRNKRYREFKSKWLAANPEAISEKKPSIAAMDKVLHAERVAHDGGKNTFEAGVKTLPFGTFVECNGVAFVVAGENLLPWSFHGYGEAISISEVAPVLTVLTPKSIVSLFRYGFQPDLHQTAESPTCPFRN